MEIRQANDKVWSSLDHQLSLAAARDNLKPERIRDRGEGTSGKIVLPMVRTAVPDVILMAVGLPDVDGIETSRDLMKAPAADRFNHQPLRRRDQWGASEPASWVIS